MDRHQLREYCLSLPLTEETTPFDQTTLVYKVCGRMYLLTDLEGEPAFNVKCDPDTALDLREAHPEITPGWHMNKRHWNTIRLDGDLTDRFIRQQVLTSYRLVIASLPRSRRDEVAHLLNESSKI